jgi:autotransporter translocation and assembly factor TamB
VILLLGVVAGVVAFTRSSLAAGALLNVAGKFLGDSVSAQSVRLSASRLTVLGLRVRSLRDEPVLEADRLDVAFNLRDMLPGGRRRFGLAEVDVARPHLTLIRRRDGTFNIALPSGEPQGNQQAAPLNLGVHVHNGSATVIDERKAGPARLPLSVENLQVEAALHPVGPSHYYVRLDIVENGVRSPVSGRATLDDARGFEMQRWQVSRLGIAPLLNVALDPSTLSVVSGEVRNVDLRYSGIADASGGIARYLDGAADLSNVTFYLAGLTKPVRAAQGAVRIFDDGMVSNELRATLAGVPMTVAGGVIGFAHPALRLGITGSGPLGALASVSPASARLPLAGRLAFGVLVEGDVTNPLVLARVDAPRVRYATLPIVGSRGEVALFGKRADVLGFSTSYAGIRVGARGSATLERTPRVEFALSAHAPGGALPYASRVIGDVPLEAVAVGGGAGTFGGSGIVTGRSGTQSVAATFAIDADGNGTAGPLLVDGPNGASLYARAVFDRRHDLVAGFASLHHFAVRTVADRGLPGIALPRLPEIPATVDARAAGILAGREVAAWGSLGVRGPWGSLAGTTAASQRSIVFAGRFHGSLGELARLSGSSGISGVADVPLRVLFDGRTALAQIEDARFTGARLGDVALTSLDGSFGVGKSGVAVYGARAGIGGGHVIASGSFGGRTSVVVATNDMPLDAARSAGLPVSGGRVLAVARVSGTTAAPKVSALVSVSGARVANQSVDGSSALDFAGRSLQVTGGEFLVGNTGVGVSGSVGGLNPTGAIAPQYDLDIGVRAFDLAAATRIAHIPLDGSADADVHVGGAGAAPQLAGTVSIPQGSVNGLAYHDAGARIEGSAAGITVHGGNVVVGTTALAFDGAASASEQALRVRTPRADLADFNDFFDAGDMLAGSGPVDLRVDRTNARIATSGDVAIANAAYRRIPVGDVAAHWATRGTTVAGSLGVHGSHGAVAGLASVSLPQSRPFDDVAHRAYVDVRATGRGIDLGTWLPVAGIAAPVVGSVDGEVAGRGTLANVAGSARASLHDGVIAGLQIDSLDVVANARGSRANIVSATLAAPALTARGSGSFGFRPTDRIALNASAHVPDLGALTRALGRKDIAVAGSGDATVAFGGTASQPAIAGTVGVANVRYAGLTVPKASAGLSFVGRTASLRDGEIDLQKGVIRFTGSAPFDPQHPGLDPNARVRAELTASDVDGAQFASLLPKGSRLQGTLNGSLTAAGRAAAPTVAGTLAFDGGYLSTPALASPLRNVAARLQLADGRANLTSAHADVGGGTIDASGSASASLRDPTRTAAFSATVRARHAGIDAPAYFNGVVDADVALAKAAGNPLTVSGSVTVPSGRIPPSALLGASSSAPSAAAPLPVAFNMDVTAGRDVRVQGGPVDVGAQGTVHVGGTLAAPRLGGRLHATGGSVAFYRTFNVQQATIAFAPADGVIPTVDAVATTNVPQPDTDVLLHVTGPATQMNVELTSSPAYSREQILGLLIGAQNFGAVSGVARSNGTGGPSFVQSVAVGTVSQQFTRQVLEPLSAHLGEGLGLQNLAINYDPYGGLSARATKGLGKHLQGEFAENFNYPRRQTIGLIAHPSRVTSVELTFFQQQGSGVFDPISLAASTNPNLAATAPATGTSGFSFVVQRHF